MQNVRFAFTPFIGFPPFRGNAGETENVADGPDIETLKQFLAEGMPGAPDATFLVLGTKRTWRTLSSFIELRAIVRACSHEETMNEPHDDDLHLVVIEGRSRETLIAAYRLPNRTFYPRDFSPAVATGQAEPLPNAENVLSWENYPEPQLA